jgi:prevent-host-death family protein
MIIWVTKMETTLSAKEAKTNFGLLLDMAQRQPITIEKRGRPFVIVLSLHDFSHYEQLEDELLALKAMQAEKEGWLDQKESADFLDQLGTVKKNK